LPLSFHDGISITIHGQERPRAPPRIADKPCQVSDFPIDQPTCSDV
jgi:hypothetical protein